TYFIAPRASANGVLPVRLRGALAVENFGREFRGFAEIDEVGRHRVAGTQVFEIGEFHFYDIEFHAAEKLRRRFVRAALARVERDQTLNRFRNPARRDLRGEPAERRAALVRAAADHHEVLGDGA